MLASFGSSHFAGLSIGGRPAEESESGWTDGGSGSPAAVVVRAPLVDHPPLQGKGKGKISEIRYPSGSEYLKDAVKYADAVIDPLSVSESGVLIFSPPTSSTFLRWSASLRRPLRMVSASLCIPSLRASYNILMCARLSFLPISGAFWSVFWLFSWIRASGFLV